MSAHSAIDLASMRPTSAIAEATLFAAYAAGTGRPVRVEACACGGILAADDGDWREVAEVLRVHNASTVHRQWADEL